jgi:hypothetical protein
MQDLADHSLFDCGISSKAMLSVVLLVGLLLNVERHFLSARDQRCGPPHYCARTDRSIEPYQRTPPVIGPAGSVITDPSFHSRILRVTDAKSDPDGLGRPMMTPASAESNAWNSDTTKFYVLTPSGQNVLYDFDPATMRARRRGLLPVTEGDFSHTRPNVLYAARSRDAAFQQYDLSNGQITVLNRFSDCIKVGSSDLAFSASVTADDDRLETMLGPEQDRNYLVYVYDRKLGCRWYNTQTGEIGGQWGPTGRISAPDRFLIHNTNISLSGKYVWVDRGYSTVGKSWLIWEVDTMKVTACPAWCSGHHALGYAHLVGPSGEHHPLDLISRRLNDLPEITSLVSDLPAPPAAEHWYDQHFSWNNVDPEDENPFCFSTYSDSNADRPGVPLETLGPWENEIACVEPHPLDSKSARIWRFAHTYSTGKNGFWSTPRGNVSQDGRFFMFTSDWQDQLGKKPFNQQQYRHDVFIVELR